MFVTLYVCRHVCVIRGLCVCVCGCQVNCVVCCVVCLGFVGVFLCGCSCVIVWLCDGVGLFVLIAFAWLAGLGLEWCGLVCVCCVFGWLARLVCSFVDWCFSLWIDWCVWSLVCVCFGVCLFGLVWCV